MTISPYPVTTGLSSNTKQTWARSWIVSTDRIVNEIVLEFMLS